MFPLRPVGISHGRTRYLKHPRNPAFLRYLGDPLVGVLRKLGRKVTGWAV